MWAAPEDYWYPNVFLQLAIFCHYCSLLPAAVFYDVLHLFCQCQMPYLAILAKVKVIFVLALWLGSATKFNWLFLSPCYTFSPSFIGIRPVVFSVILLTNRLTNHTEIITSLEDITSTDRKGKSSLLFFRSPVVVATGENFFLFLISPGERWIQ